MVSVPSERGLTVERDLADECRELHHGDCGHLASGLTGFTFRRRSIFVCTCPCHAACPSLTTAVDDMESRCTCPSTARERQREAQRLGIKPRKRRVIKSARDDGWEISVGYIVAMPILVLLFAGAVVIAIKMTDAAGYVAIVVAVLLGIYLAWTLALVLIGGLIARVVKGIAKNASARRPVRAVDEEAARQTLRKVRSRTPGPVTQS